MWYNWKYELFNVTPEWGCITGKNFWRHIVCNNYGGTYYPFVAVLYERAQVYVGIFRKRKITKEEIPT